MRSPWFLFLILGFLWGLGPVWGQVRPANPGFADHETLSYTETIGSMAPRPFTATLTLVGLGAGARYEYRTKGADLESVYRIDPATMISMSSETLTRAADSTVRRTADYQDLKQAPGAHDLVVTDMGSLPIVLRGLAWGQVSSATLVYLGNATYSGSGISFELQVVGRDRIDTGRRVWECWHVTMGLGGALSLMMAKTELWFAVEGTHPMVKTSGPAGGPGSPLRSLVLQEYTAGKKP